MKMKGLTPPLTPAARGAFEIASTYHCPALLNHVIRSWLWAEAFAALEGRGDIDHELLYVAAMLHDIGITSAYDNVKLSYEEAGGHVAVALTAGAQWVPARRQRVLDVVIRHNWVAVDPDLDAEGYLLEKATALDITGAHADELPHEFLREVVDARPRLDLAAQFTACVTDQARRKPDSAAFRLITSGLADKLAYHPLEPR
ncbi:MAG: hypothetical protein FWF25_04780 [Propionibacteriaceae bacterium]|nr:hypothetical protein [Propionibacteriaceae bacterium]